MSILPLLLLYPVIVFYPLRFDPHEPIDPLDPFL